MAEDAAKIVKRKKDDIDSDTDESLSFIKKSGSEHDRDTDSVGDPWQEMNEEAEMEDQKEREHRRKEKQNELLGIDTNQLKWDDETGLVVPIKNLVNFAGRGRDIKERRQSAFGFAHFSTEESSQKQIAEFQNDYGIDALLSLLESDDNICRRYSALALGNIVSSRKFAEKCIEFGVLEAMLPLAIDEETDLETRRYCMLAVANMAAEQSTHQTILKQLESIIILVDSLDEEIQKCATLCLQNLSANRDIVMDQNMQESIQPLVNLISITKGKHIPLPDAKLHAVASLRGLCVADVLRLRIINEGVLRAFLQIIDAPPSNAILVEISAILCGFSSLYETHVDLLQPAVLHSIFLLAMGDITEAQQFGSTTLANLASNSSNHDKLIESNAICNLLIMCDYNDHRVKASATRALANFASNDRRHQALLDEGCLEIMIRILNSSDSYNNMFSALFFSILCENNKLHQILSIPEIIQPLFHLVVMADTNCIVETIRYSVLALANLANSGDSHPFILSEIEIQMNSFFSLASNEDEECQRYFGLLLSNLAENVNSHQLLSTPVALSKIIKLLDCQEIEVVLNCLSFILKLLSTTKDIIRLRVANMFSLRVNKLCADSDSNTVKREELLFMISAYFSNITTSQEVRKQLSWSSIVSSLGEVLSINDIHQDIQIHAINAMANLRDVNTAVTVMVQSENPLILPLILKCIQSPIIDIHSSALRLMSGISSHQIAIEKLIALNTIHLLGPFVRSPHSAFRKYAYICLANYASHEKGEIDLNDVNLIKCYLNVSIDEKADIEEMRCCLFALANTAYHAQNKDVIHESGIIIMKTLLDYVQCHDAVINEYASLLLANCSVLLPTHSMFGYHDIIQMIIHLASNNGDDHNGGGNNETINNPQTILNGIKCLRNLAFYDEHIHLLLECKIIDFVVGFANERKHKKYHQYSPFIDKQLAALVYNLTSHPSCIKHIAREDLILSVTSLLISNENETRRDAARALTSISSHTDIATPLFLDNGECLDYILSSLKFNDDLDLYHSLAIILGYIFSLQQVQDGTCTKVTRTHILSLLRKRNRQIQLAALWATSTGSDNIIMGDDEMLQIVASLAEPQLPTEQQEQEHDTETESRPCTGTDGVAVNVNSNPNLKEKSLDKESEEDKLRFGESPLLLKIIRRRALITLVNYAKNQEHHKLIIKNCPNVIANAFNLNDCNDMDVILLSAMFLSNLSNSLDVAVHESLISNHDVSSLDLYLGYNNENIQIFATRTLAALSNTAKFAKSLIISERIIPLLCLTTMRGHLVLNQEIAAFFQNLTRHKKLIPMILEQHLIPTLMELLKTNTDLVLRSRVIKALQNCCCCPDALTRMVEVERGVPILWNLLLKFVNANNQKQRHKDAPKEEDDVNEINNDFISAIIKILSLFTQRKDCKEMFLVGLWHNLSFDNTLTMTCGRAQQKQKTSDPEAEDENDDDVAHELLKEMQRVTSQQDHKTMEVLAAEFKSDNYAQNLCKKRLKALLSVVFYARTNEKLLIVKILKQLSSFSELHEIWMSEELDKTDTFDSDTNANRDDEDFYSDISLSYLTLYSSFLVISLNTNAELIELGLVVLSQLCVYHKTASKLLEFDQIQNRFNIIHELQTYSNHEWTSIRALSFNVAAYLMEFIQSLIATNSTDTNKATKCFDYLQKFYHHPHQPTVHKAGDREQKRFSGINLIKINAKIPDIRLQAQTARLLATFSAVPDYVDWLNNDDMYALLFLLAEQAWRIGGDTELKPEQILSINQSLNQKDNTMNEDEEEEDPTMNTEEEAVKEADDAFLMTQSKDIAIIHKSVVTCLANMVLKLKGEFSPESTTLMAAILRYAKDKNPEIRSLAFICISGKGKRGIAPLFHIWEDAVALLVTTLESTKTLESTFASNVQSNIMKAFVLLSENVHHQKHMLQCNTSKGSIFKLLMEYAQCKDSYVRMLALTALKNMISTKEWQEGPHQARGVYVDSLMKMLRTLFAMNRDRSHTESAQNYVTQNRHHRFENINELLLMITSHIAKIENFQKMFLRGDRPTIIQSLIRDVIMNSDTLSNESFLATLTMYNLSQNQKCHELMIQNKVIESCVYITLKYTNSLRHCYVALSCIANLSSVSAPNVICGRDVHLQTEHEQIVHEQKHLNQTNSFPLFALETLHQISFSLNTHHLQPPQQQSIHDQQYTLSSVQSLVSLIAARMTSHKAFKLNNMDLCYLNAIIYYFASTNFHCQSYALITFLNFLCKSTPSMFAKIIASKSWIPTLLSLIQSTNLSIKNVVLKCILRIIDDGDQHKMIGSGGSDEENINANNGLTQSLRAKMERKPQLLRFLDQLFCDSHFPKVLELAFSEQNLVTLTAVSRILLILCENLPISTLLIHRDGNHSRNQLLSALIEFTLHSDKDIKLNGAASLSCFLSHSGTDSNIPQRILASAENGIDSMATNNRGLMAFYEMITNKAISGYSNKDSLNAKNKEVAKPIGATVITALCALSNNLAFTKQFVNTNNGLGIITHEMLYGIAVPENAIIANDAAQILRNVCREHENIKIFLEEDGCKCLLKLIASKTVQLKFLAAGALADIVYHATSNEDKERKNDLFTLTTEHLAPYMTTITDCLLKLLVADAAMDGHPADSHSVVIPTAKFLKSHGAHHGLGGDKGTFSARKLVRICLALLHRLCKDSDTAKKLIVEAGAIKSLCSKWFESIKKRHPESDLILSLLKCLATFHSTQIQFIEQNGGNVLHSLVHHPSTDSSGAAKSVSSNHHHAADIIASLVKNEQTHQLVATHKVYSLLLTIRHSPDAEARKIGMDTLLTFLENKSIHQYVRDDSDLAQTLAAISKFGASKQIKQRSTNIIKTMLGTKAYLDMTRNVNKERNTGNRPKFAKAKTLKSGIRSPSQKPKKSPPMARRTTSSINNKELKVVTKDQVVSFSAPTTKAEVAVSSQVENEQKEQIKNDVIEVNEDGVNKEDNDANTEINKENENENMNTMIEGDQEAESESVKPIKVNTMTSDKTVDFWHDAEEADGSEAAT